ncbi:hypothetical protein J437_LFUL017264 [Ladona fulva]|uniref:Kelch repeat protein n=1 Tax=Ladona fulva TaxID=123851 RepID=A0A8K0KQR8_LADFU|nr:hypothetical protein J437_LFUL017264 [Ladona fulva]
MITPMPSKRSSVGVGVLNNLLYAVGGYDGTSRQCLNSVICYNPDTEVWTRVADMSENRSGAGTVAAVAAASGVKGDASAVTSTEHARPLVSAVASCHGLLTAISIGPTPFFAVVDSPRAIPSLMQCCVPFSECLYSLADSSLFGLTEDYTGILASIDASSLSVSLWNEAIGVVDGIMYAIGGHDGPVASKSVEAYNPKSNTWSPVADMTVCRRNAAVVCISNMLYVVGGDDGKTNFAFVEYYHPKSDTWSILPSLMSIGRSYPGVAVIEKPV